MATVLRVAETSVAKEGQPPPSSPSRRRPVNTRKEAQIQLLWLALGTFAIGTENFMIAGLLPPIASDLSVTIQGAGQLVTFFALAYAVSSPVLTTATGGFDRRNVLILSMVSFIIANILASEAGSYWALMGARILLACAAGLYVPNANALATTLVTPERRASALAIVNGGTTLSLIFGVPLGTVVGHQFGWRMVFVGVAVLALLALVGLLLGLRRSVGGGLPVISLRDRIAVAKRPDVLIVLLVTMIWGAGAYTNYTYLAPYLANVAGIAGGGVGVVFLVWGVSAAIGIFSSGVLTDRIGSRPMIIVTLSILTIAFASLSVSARLLSPAVAVVPVFIAIALWGISGWAFYPAQLARLVTLSGPSAASVAISLNSSLMSLGLCLGAALGSVTLVEGTVADLGWVGAVCELGALALSLVSLRRERAPARAAVLSNEI
jgi:predicted MFS family arabinose efflux permease